MRFALTLISLLLPQLVSFGAVADTPADQAILQKYNYEQLEQVADYLGAKVETPTEKILSCDPPQDKVSAWLSGPVRELIDRARTKELSKFRQDGRGYMAKVKGCSARCTCNAYTLMLSDMSDDAESNQYKDFDSLITAETKKLNKEQSLSCAKKLTWFCKSALHTYLKQQP